MKKLYRILQIAVWCLVGIFIGSSIYRYYDYKTYPERYICQSAPWYLNIEIQGVFTAIIVFAIIVSMWIMKKKMK